VPLFVWIALLVLVAATIWAVVHVFAQARAAWRQFKTFGRVLDETASTVEASADRLAATSDTFGSDFPRLEASLERLRRDLARLAVLRQAVQDARDSFGWILALYPRK
jgi:uncharacterized membrane protein